MDPSAWWTQQLAEFVASVSQCTTETAAARATVERAAEVLDADVAAIMVGDELLAAVGYAEGTEPLDELKRIQPGAPDSRLEVPGVGWCGVAVAGLAYPAGATLVLARRDGLTRQETALLAGMARVAAMTMTMLSLLDRERGAREEVERLAREQAALRRVATLVARGVPSGTVFDAVSEEVGRLLPADVTLLCRYDPQGHLARIGEWGRTPDPIPRGGRARLGSRDVGSLVFETGRPARIDDFGDDAEPGMFAWRPAGLRSAVGAPISVEGRLWGLVVVMSMSGEPLPADTEARLTGFTELVATAIANAEANAELKASRARIAATADETRQRIERDLHDGAQQRLVTLALQIRAAQAKVPAQLDNLAAELDQVAAGLSSTLDELREYTRGIHPGILAHGGLAPALKTLVRRSSVQVALDLRVRERLPEHVEVTAYYVLSEALANAAKHAKASTVHVLVDTAAGVLRLDVRDDGIGGADPARGSGLIGLRDRVEATGGTFRLTSRHGEGTHLFIELPIRPLASAPG